MPSPTAGRRRYEVAAKGSGTEIRQTAIFDTFGLFGLLYWYGIYPVHALVFRGMLRQSRPAGGASWHSANLALIRPPG